MFGFAREDDLKALECTIDRHEKYHREDEIFDAQRRDRLNHQMRVLELGRVEQARLILLAAKEIHTLRAQVEALYQAALLHQQVLVDVGAVALEHEEKLCSKKPYTSACCKPSQEGTTLP